MQSILFKVLLAAVVTVGVLATSASASHFRYGSYTWASPPGASVVGSGNVTYPDFPTQGETTVERVIISARTLPTGQLSGSILTISPFGFNKADVTCMKIVGDTIYVGGSLDPGFDFYLGETFSQIAFGIRNGDPDVVASAIFRRADVDPCDILSAFQPVFTVDQGDFVITGL